MSDFKIWKFGGTSVGSLLGLENISYLLKKNKGHQIVIPSAPSETTNWLLQGARHQVETNSAFPKELFLKLKDRFSNIYCTIPYSMEIIDEKFSELEEILENPSLDLDGDYHLAETAAMGELTNKPLLANFLRMEGFKVREIDSREIIIMEGSPIAANYSSDSKTLIKDRLNDFDGITVVSGYCGRGRNGRTFVFDRGGSDKTQTVIAGALNPVIIYNCTDVDGVYQADPKLFSPEEKERLNLQPLKRVGYEVMKELSGQGAPVLYPGCVEDLEESNIKLYVRNTFNPDNEGTLVGPMTDEERYSPSVIAVTGKSGKKKGQENNSYKTVSLTTGNMEGRKGFVAAFGNAHIKTDIDMMSTGGISISGSSANDSPELERITYELSKWGKVNVYTGTSIVAIVGTSIGRNPHLIAKFFSILGKEKIEVGQISKPTFDLDYSFGVQVHAQDYERALRAIYLGMVHQY